MSSLVVKQIENVKITFNGYEFSYLIPKNFRDIDMKEWKTLNENKIKEIKEILKKEFHDKKISDNLYYDSETND